MANDDVQVTHSAGCPIDGITSQHTHTQDDWRAIVDAAGEALMKRLGRQ